MLLLFRCTVLRRDGYSKVSLSVQKANYALRMYEKAGFKIDTISISWDIEDGPDLVVGRGVQVSHCTTHYIHKSLEVIILLLDQVVFDRISLDKIVFEDGVRPDTELGAALGFDAVAYRDDYVEVE